MRETEILVEQQPPQGVLSRGHAGRVINKRSQVGEVYAAEGEKLARVVRCSLVQSRPQFKNNHLAEM